MLKLVNLEKKFRNRLIFKLDLEIEKGLTLLVGENGSGKSTLLRIISKLDKSYKGKYFSDCKNMSYLPDKFYFPKSFKAYEFLNLYLGDDKNLIIYKAMALFDLQNVKVEIMSKGMLQKLGIIAISLVDADLYLFDEPMSGLDKASMKVFVKIVKELIDKEKTVIISTHKMEMFKNMDKKVVEF